MALEVKEYDDFVPLNVC